jgi:hypothetical protein
MKSEKKCEIELDTPTIASVMPKKIKRRDSFSVTNASQNEAKLTCVKLNRQTPCPPRGAVPANHGNCRRLFHSQHPDRFRSWRRPSRLCQTKDLANAPLNQAEKEPQTVAIGKEARGVGGNNTLLRQRRYPI